MAAMSRWSSLCVWFLSADILLAAAGFSGVFSAVGLLQATMKPNNKAINAYAMFLYNLFIQICLVIYENEVAYAQKQTSAMKLTSDFDAVDDDSRANLDGKKLDRAVQCSLNSDHRSVPESLFGVHQWYRKSGLICPLLPYESPVYLA